MILHLTDELVNSVLPNTLVTVDEEISMAERLQPYADAAARWLTSHVLGSYVPEDDSVIVGIAEATVVIKAVLDALPALDLVVTPTGFGVVSSDSLAPASKERIERLMESLRIRLKETVIRLQYECVKSGKWRETDRGRYYCHTFLPFLLDVQSLVGTSDIFDVYDKARNVASFFEHALADMFIGHVFLHEFRDAYVNQEYLYTHPLVTAIRGAVLRYVQGHINDRYPSCVVEHEVWHYAEAILRVLREDPVLHHVWHSSTGDKFDVEPFQNNRKGGYFF